MPRGGDVSNSLLAPASSNLTICLVWHAVDQNRDHPMKSIIERELQFAAII